MAFRLITKPRSQRTTGCRKKEPQIYLQKYSTFYLNYGALNLVGATTEYVSVQIDEENHEVRIMKEDPSPNFYKIGRSAKNSNYISATFSCTELRKIIESATDEKKFVVNEIDPNTLGFSFTY